ncbi:hypothetical protein HIM_05217 [Hirsutella minnesotensis 3608]|uniref:Uncharacterized protein n=1 Tax=Hirsutella minnesotensis 3608 TaxID=1043627 RepID=A0A0F7ZKJ0_9HYPO|nr:hypothetical protein HIM_05217 [Hirsutella minnesotensis 3608]
MKDISCKPQLFDYSRADLDSIKQKTADGEEDLEFWSVKGQRKSKNFVYLAWGRETGGRELILNVKDSEITEDVLEMDTLPPRGIVEYLNELEEAHISKEKVLAQSECWGSDLDIQYLRQLYRQHGWPEAIRRKDAENAAEGLMEGVLAQRDDEWETVMEDWMPDCELELSSGDGADLSDSG